MRGATPEPCLSTRAAAEMLLVSLDLVQSRIFNGMEDVGGRGGGEVNYAKGGWWLYGK